MDSLPNEIGEIIINNLTLCGFAKLTCIHDILGIYKFKNAIIQQQFFDSISPILLTKLLKNRYISESDLRFLLHSSLREKKVENVKILMRDQRVPLDGIKDFVISICETGDFELIEKALLFDNEYSKIEKILFEACRIGNWEIFIKCFNKLDKNNEKIQRDIRQYILHDLLPEACTGGSFKIVDFLLKIEIIGPINSEDTESPMRRASSQRQYHIIKRLLNDKRFKCVPKTGYYIQNPIYFSDIWKLVLDDEDLELPYEVFSEYSPLTICKMAINSYKFDPKKLPIKFLNDIFKSQYFREVPELLKALLAKTIDISSIGENLIKGIARRFALLYNNCDVQRLDSLIDALDVIISDVRINPLIMNNEIINTVRMHKYDKSIAILKKHPITKNYVDF